MNVKNFNTYSSKFVLSVVDLTKVELATEEDRAFRIDYWAKIFKAKTWEDLKMLVKDNEYLEEAANSLYVANADEIVRQQCRAREDSERRERTLERDKQIWMKKYEKAQADNIILQEDNISLQKDNIILQKDNIILQENNISLQTELEGFTELTQILLNEGKVEELKRATQDKEYRENLYKSYQL